jgi:hypothetical protein
MTERHYTRALATRMPTCWRVGALVYSPAGMAAPPSQPTRWAYGGGDDAGWAVDL